MTIAENIGPDRNVLAHHPLRRIAPAIDLRPDILDEDACVLPPLRVVRRRAMRPVPAPDFHRSRRAQRGAQHSHLQRRDHDPAANRPLFAARQHLADCKPVAEIEQTGGAEQLLDRDFLCLPLLRIDQAQRPLGAAVALTQQHNEGVIRAAQQPLRPLLIERRGRLLHQVDAGDERSQVETLGLRRQLFAIGDDREPARPAELESHRHHDAGRKRGGERISLTVMRLDLPFRKPGRYQFGHQPLGIMALRKTDRRCDLAELLVLLE